MTQYELYSKYIANNVPLLLLGKSGTGKSEIIKSIAKDLGMPLVDLRMSQLPPEDLNGLPAPTADGKAFHYLLPAWFNDFQPDTPFILFLDEINQASTNTINALYAIVHDRMIAGRYNPNMRVVGAGNLLSESDFLNELPQPLLNRFVVKQHQAEENAVMEYLGKKYADNKKAGKVLKALKGYEWLKTMNPRALERVIKTVCVMGIEDQDEIQAQTKDDGLTQLIVDSLKSRETPEMADESLTAQLIKKAKQLSETHDENLADEIKELING